ncbi:disaggregatase related repeat-containing protein [Methanosarcina acetivorans]|nr:disaggregatase related repeat-containing protein [Methanosarcina acetivorans]
MERKLLMLFLVALTLLINIQIVLCASPTAPIVYIDTDGSGDYNCDGKNDHIEINEALSFVNKNSDFTTVHLNGSNTYWINDTLYIGSNTILEGDSDAVIKLIDYANWNIEYKGFIEAKQDLEKNITIRGFEIDGNCKNQYEKIGNSFYNMINLKKSYNVTVHDMYLHDGLGDGIKVFHDYSREYETVPTNINVYNNTIFEIGHDAVWLKHSSNASIYNNNITIKADAAIRLTETMHIKIYNNTITSNYKGYAGIELDKKMTDRLMDDIEIYNNLIYHTHAWAIWLVGYGKYDKDKAKGVWIHHNVIYDTGTSSTLHEAGGIVVQGFNNTIIENNVIDGNRKYGVAYELYPAYGIPKDNGFVTIVRNNIISNTIRNVADVGSGWGVKDCDPSNHTFILEYNCVYNSAAGNYVNVAPTTDINVDPLYADISNRDYHLKSKAGRWSNAGWTTDNVSSPCIDAGHPLSDYSNEPEDNGDRINIGAYGNTKYASNSGDAPININHPPVMDPIPSATVEIGKTLNFEVNASDEDGDSLTYSVLDIPEEATFDGNSRIFSWTPISGQEGSYTVIFEVSDGELKDSTTANITVVENDSNPDEDIKIYDNRLREASPDTVIQNKPFIDVGGTDNVGRYRDVMWFNLSEYSDQKISKAIISLYWYYPEESRPEDTVIEVYRPASWNPSYVSWNNRDNGVKWTNAGGDWYDKEGVSQGNTPYAKFTIKGKELPDNRYYELDITDLVKEYVSGEYENTGFLIKARSESNNYIAFYSSDCGNESQEPKLKITKQVPAEPVNVAITGAKDNRLREASPDTVFQDKPFIDVGGTDDVGRYRDVMWFNLSEYSDQEISKAIISLYWYYPEESRPEDTVIEVYRPASWNPSYVSWNNRDNGVKWTNAGGDWYDKEGVSQGNTPYAKFTIKGKELPDNRYYELDITDLVKEYVSGEYENTGFLIKAKTESNNYIAFYSNDWEIESQRPILNMRIVQ